MPLDIAKVDEIAPCGPAREIELKTCRTFNHCSLGHKLPQGRVDL